MSDETRLQELYAKDNGVVVLDGSIRHAGRLASIIQAMADGKTFTMAAKCGRLKVEEARMLLFKRQQELKIRSLVQLVAHYLRNGWID